MCVRRYLWYFVRSVDRGKYFISFLTEGYPGLRLLNVSNSMLNS